MILDMFSSVRVIACRVCPKFKDKTQKFTFQAQFLSHSDSSARRNRQERIGKNGGNNIKNNTVR